MIFYSCYHFTNVNILNIGYLLSTKDDIFCYIVIFTRIINPHWSYGISCFDSSVVCDIIYSCTSKKWKGNILIRIYIILYNTLPVYIYNWKNSFYMCTVIYKIFQNSTFYREGCTFFNFASQIHSHYLQRISYTHYLCQIVFSFCYSNGYI